MRLGTSDTQPRILSELRCSAQDLQHMRNRALELEANRTSEQRQVSGPRDWLRRFTPRGQNEIPRSEMLLVAISPHLLRCSALRNAGRPGNHPRIVFLQVTPLACWLPVGVMLRTNDFSRAQYRALSRARPESRHILLREWFESCGNPLWCRPDTFDWEGIGDAGLFSADVIYQPADELPLQAQPPFPILCADNPEVNAAILADPSLSWRRTVYTNDSEVAKLLVSCEHPDVRMLYADADADADCRVAGGVAEGTAASQPRAFFLNSFLNHSFVVEMTGPAERNTLWDFAENTFGRIFGRESCFDAGSSPDEAIHVRLASPAAPLDLRWRVEQTADGPLLSDALASFAGVPPYLRSRRAFMLWAFGLF